ncbi:MAG: glycosyltransferase [Candidatus Bathyarchaeia archaeon]
MLKTAEHLRKLGVSVDISLEFTPNLSTYDIVHLMNITRVKHTATQLRNAIRQHKKVVLSPIYWNTKEVSFSYIRQIVSCLENIDSLRALTRAFLLSLTSKTIWMQTEELLLNRKMALFVLSNVNCILPNSKAEMEILKSDYIKVFRKHNVEFVITPNGVEPEVFYAASPEPFKKQYGLSNFILNVGRFSYRKNQLSLIKALKGTNLKCVLIGEPTNSQTYHYTIKDTIDKLYYERCKKEASSSFTFLKPMRHNELASAYAACKVFVLPSLYETPGLSALEAALAGANICITRGGATREYFSDFAFYCEPHDINSIREAIFKAYDAPKSNNLKERILKNFTWDRVAKVTLEAYERVLKK